MQLNFRDSINLACVSPTTFLRDEFAPYSSNPANTDWKAILGATRDLSDVLNDERIVVAWKRHEKAVELAFESDIIVKGSMLEYYQFWYYPQIKKRFQYRPSMVSFYLPQKAGCRKREMPQFLVELYKKQGRSK